MYNRSEEKPIGKKRVRVINPKNNRGYSVEFIVLKGNYRSLLGLRASQQMQLVTLNRQNILAIESSRCETGNLSKSTITAEFQDLFKGEGRLPGELHLGSRRNSQTCATAHQEGPSRVERQAQTGARQII